MRRALAMVLVLAAAGCGSDSKKPRAAATATVTPPAAPGVRAVCERAGRRVGGKARLDAAAVRSSLRAALTELEDLPLSEGAALARDHLEGQLPVLRRLDRLQRRGAPEPRRAEVAATLDLKRRLASGTDPQKTLGACFALSARIGDRYEERAYLRRAIPLLKKGRRIVSEPGWSRLTGDSDNLVEHTIRYAFSHIYGDFGGKWADLTPPSRLQAAHDDVQRATDALVDLTEAADDKITTEGRPISEAREMLRGFPARQRAFHAAARHYLAAVR